MITRELPPDSGGIGYYVFNLSKKLIERGHEITVITRGSTKRSVREVVEGIEIFRGSFFPVYPLHIWIHSAFVNALLKSLGPKLDLVHLHSPLVPPVKTSLPIITTVHTPMKVDAKYHEVFDFYSLAERLQCMVFYPSTESKLFNISKSLTAVSLSVCNELKTYGLDPSKVAVVGNGVDEKMFAPVDNRDLTEKYVLYTGVLRARKGLFDLLKCAKYVCRIRPEVRFVICGTGPFFRKLEDEVRREGMREKFILMGHVKRDKLIWLYQNAAVHVVPSHYEGLPTVMLEAMSCGLPVVATNVGGNNEVISSGTNGFLVPPKAPKVMGEIILKLLADDELRETIGKKARLTIEKCYTWDKIADKMTDCYANLLNLET
jgi:glycosyltransferase involved in cell wall biosynthesis